MEIAVPGIVGVLAALAADVALGARLRPAEDMRGAPGRLLEVLSGVLPDRLVESSRAQELARTWCDALPFERWGIRAEDGRGRLALLFVSSAACAAALGVVSLSPIGAMAGAVVPSGASCALLRARGRAAARDAEEALPEAFTALSMSLGSGHSLSQGMRFVGSHAAEPVRSEFTRISYAILCGVPAAEALDDMLERVNAPGLGLVALSLKVSQKTGAPLADLLSESAAMAGERIELKRRLDVKTSQARMSAHMVACMPVAMVAVLSLLSADFRRGLTTPVGAASVVVALALNAVALAAIRRIMRVEL